MKVLFHLILSCLVVFPYKSVFCLFVFGLGYFCLFFSNEKQKSSGSREEGKWRGSRRSGGKENYTYDTLHEKESIFN